LILIKSGKIRTEKSFHTSQVDTESSWIQAQKIRYNGLIEEVGMKRWKGLLSDAGLLYSAAIWGATFFMVKGVLQHVSPL